MSLNSSSILNIKMTQRNSIEFSFDLSSKNLVINKPKRTSQSKQIANKCYKQLHIGSKLEYNEM